MKIDKAKVVDDFNGIGEMVEIPCSKFYTGGQPIHVCKQTGLVRTKDLRSAEEIANAWSKEVYSTEFGNQTYTARIPAVKARQTYVADFIDVNVRLKDKSICDIGAGEGQFLEIVSSQDYEAKVYGIEPSKTNCSLLKSKGFECFEGTIEDYSASVHFTDRQFDIVTTMWTLVNSHSCLDMIKAAYKMVKSNGYLVVAEGSRILVPFKKPLHYYFSKLPVDLHPYHFSANSLKNLLEIVGFEIIMENRFIDSDYLCLIARKTEKPIKNQFEVDNYIDVLSFFERWHLDTQKYYLDM